MQELIAVPLIDCVVALVDCEFELFGRLLMLRQAWRIVILIVGITVLLVGIALIVLPGPAFVVIPVGLAILATEYAWARRWLQFIRESAEKGADKVRLGSLLFRRRRPPGYPPA